MRIAGVAVVVVLGVVLAIGSSGAGKLTRPAAPKPIVSKDGLLGLREIAVQAHVTGDEQWRETVGLTQNALRADVEGRLGKIVGLALGKSQSPTAPRFLVQVIGHVIAGFPEADPPSATYITVGVLQPVSLIRTGPDGAQIVTTGITTTTTLLLSGKASTMPQRIREKLDHLLSEFEADYEKANPRPSPAP
jgi:hypothetical protein